MHGKTCIWCKSFVIVLSMKNGFVNEKWQAVDAKPMQPHLLLHLLQHCRTVDAQRQASKTLLKVTAQQQKQHKEDDYLSQVVLPGMHSSEGLQVRSSGGKMGSALTMRPSYKRLPVLLSDDPALLQLQGRPVLGQTCSRSMGSSKQIWQP